MTDEVPVDPEIAAFVTEDQDAEQVAKIYDKLKQLMTPGEKVRYIAVQKPIGIDLSPDIVALTNRRFLYYQPNMFGRAVFNDYIWRDLRSVELREHTMRATLTIHAADGTTWEIGNLVKEQARRLYAIAQEMEEAVREELRIRAMEEKRAEAGGIVLQSGPSTVGTAAPADEPMQALAKLKQLADAGLITAEEYDAKKKEILARL